MADGTRLNANSTEGDLIATDEITDGGVAQDQKVQRNKAGFGENNKYKDVSHLTPLPVIDGLKSPQSTHGSAVAISAGASSDIDSDQIASDKTGELVEVLLAASVPWKAQLKTVSKGVPTPALATIFGKAGETFVYRPTSKKFFTQAEDVDAGFDGFRTTMTNLDTSQPADLYATYLYDEV